jgi:hypothetical protein
MSITIHEQLKGIKVELNELREVRDKLIIESNAPDRKLERPGLILSLDIVNGLIRKHLPN